MFSLSVCAQIKIEAEWILRELNLKADLLSRVVDLDDWMLNPVMFAELDRAWGPHKVDRFASFHTCQLPRFNNQCWNPGSESVDTFTVNRAGEVKLVIPTNSTDT